VAASTKQPIARALSLRRTALALSVSGLVALTALPIAQPNPVRAEEPQAAPVEAIHNPASAPLPLNRGINSFANGGALMLNMHGLLFHDDPRDVRENIEYAAWLNSGVIRVFATDKIGHINHTGGEIGERIAAMAPLLREHRVKLAIVFMDQYREVPGEPNAPLGWMQGYRQLMLPFYTHVWRGAYRQFMRDIIGTVKGRGVLDIIWAWELGNEIHTQEDPGQILVFINEVVEEIRQVDRITPILPGTMGGGILDPGIPDSPIARDLYCESPIFAYTVHTFDWLRDEDNGGDAPIRWDLDHTTWNACENGRALPVIVEELGTSLELPGIYRADEPWKRLELELRQIRRVLEYPSVSAIGVWSAESPRVKSARHDLYRGLTSHRNLDGTSGSCYRPEPNHRPGTRCELELAYRALPRLPDLSVVAQGYQASLKFSSDPRPRTYEPLIEQLPD
jgi:hypothetical protein